LKTARYAVYAIVALALVAACVIAISVSTSRSAARSTTGAADPGTHAAAVGDARPAFVGAQDGMKSRRLQDKAARAALFQAILKAQSRRLGARTGSATRDPGDPEQAGGEAPVGELDKEYIRDAVSEVIPEIRKCYEMVLRDAPALEGRLVVSFSILGEPDLAGMIDDINVEDDSDEVMRSSAPLTKCMIDALSTLEFPPPENGGVVEVRYPFSFSAQDK
jgi:hypothetical protein